jgi:Domain of unknown function (DUF4340)
MVKRSTWILLATLALVVFAYFVIKNRPINTSQTTPTAIATTFLVAQADGVLQSLHIYDTKGNSIQMQRDPSKTWVITAPTSGVADQGLAGAAETQVGALHIVTILDPSPVPSAIGLENPHYTMEIGFISGASHRIEIGDVTPTGSGYYIRFDGRNIYVIEQSGIDALLGLLKAPPFPATVTPVATIPSINTSTSEIASPTP